MALRAINRRASCAPEIALATLPIMAKGSGCDAPVGLKCGLVQGRVQAVAGEQIERRLVAILMADVTGYSRLIGIDDEGTLPS